ncbi:MAG: LL-diaminopimelate aminotransferase [Methanobrevibacter sp.]|jgi:LL-diaminopimelate aminotransferase|nr:LL-diaminopimelate aminotransferase [Candidatus Methanovirga basalitermitum]
MSITINDNYLLLEDSYLFVEIARRLENFQKKNPEKNVIKMGIGDVTKPLAKTVIKAFKDAVDEMGDSKSFRGYGPEQGYSFLAESIIKNDFNPNGVSIDTDEVFISDGAKCDAGNIQEIFGLDNKVCVTDPVYPVYVDTNVMAGRGGSITIEGTYSSIVYMSCTEENNFVPELPKKPVDLIYLCFPNNPTGITLNKDQLSKFVDFANKNNSIILFDAAYESFITESDVPHSIYEIDGAKEVAIELKSFSKTAGFTGTRCAYTIVPKELNGFSSNGDKVSINKLWNRRQTTKFNGVSYPVQRAAEATFSPEGRKEIQENIDYYMENAKIIRSSLSDLGLNVYGGVNSPYIWVKTPNNMKSWDFFDLLLNEANIVGTPGSGFGLNGEGYLRLTAFNSLKNTKKAMNRISKIKL